MLATESKESLTSQLQSTLDTILASADRSMKSATDYGRQLLLVMVHMIEGQLLIVNFDDKGNLNVTDA